MSKKLSTQVKAKIKKPSVNKSEYDGDIGAVISTGSTLLDLAISGGRVRGGGIPGGILVEVFGPSASGKTVLLCEIAGAVQRQDGDIMFHDPEARLNQQFARIFDLDTTDIDYTTPDTIPEVFSGVRKWEPKGKGIHGVFADSLAALSTDMEMDEKKGDKMGMRRPKEFSEETRKTCRVIAKKNLLMVCSNQIRDNIDGGPYAPKHKTPGGVALGFYSSLRLQASNPVKIKREVTVAGKKVERVIGVTTSFSVFKSSIWKPYRTAPLTIIFDYGIDNTRDCLQFIKAYTNNTTYMVGKTKLDISMDKSITMVEEAGMEGELKEEVIDLWELIESKFKEERKTKIR